MSKDKKGGGFVVSNESADSGLSCYAQVVYMQLRRRCSPEGTCYPSIRTLTQCCGIGSKSKVIDAIRELEATGWILVTRERKKVNRYLVKRGTECG